MLFRTTFLVALLAITPAFATLNERDVDEPSALNIRSEMDEDAIVARDITNEELERRFFGALFKIAKGAMKLGKGLANRHRRDLQSEDELFERDLESEEQLFERDFEPIELLERDLELEEDLFERDFEGIDELD